MKDLDVLNHLVSDTDITDVIADRIWTTWLPEQATLPAITCNYVSESPVNSLINTENGSETISVNIWTENKTTLNTLIGLIRTRMSGFGVRLSMVNLNEEEQGIYRYSIDYSIW
jgi:MarR-like DNA-binding transcriptional regulator SgrR of sgrS sRNA